MKKARIYIETSVISYLTARPSRDLITAAEGKMWVDEIVEEVRAVREAHAARFDYDLDAIFQDLQAQEQQSQRQIVTFAPRRKRPSRKTHPEPSIVVRPAVS